MIGSGLWIYFVVVFKRENYWMVNVEFCLLRIIV